MRDSIYAAADLLRAAGHACPLGGDEVIPHVGVVTLAVGDLHTALAFYRDGLGLPSTGA